jgi:hypothetical protein
MDFYQGVAVDYLRADRALFVNTECCIQLNEGLNPDKTGPHWYCDAVAIDLRNSQVFLGEISYAKHLTSLIHRLKDWHQYWAGVKAALVRDSCIKQEWSVRPWCFVPERSVELLKKNLAKIEKETGSPALNVWITPLEKVQPWLYRSYHRRDSQTDKEGESEPSRRL